MKREAMIKKLIENSKKIPLVDGTPVYREEGHYDYLIDDRPGHEKKEYLIFSEPWINLSDWSIDSMLQTQEYLQRNGG